MIPAEYDLTIVQGATYEKTFRFEKNGAVLNLTGCLAKMQVRQRITDPTFYAEFSSENGKLILDGTAGKLTVKLSATQTEAYKLRQGVYDLDISFPDGTVIKPLSGGVSLIPEVTR